MSDIRFNRWLHQSGTGGVSQDSSGNIGIGTTVPTMALDVRGDVNIGNTININNASGIISATTFTGTTGTFSGNVSAVDGTFTGNVTIGGTLTYEDVSNIDAVGIITAQKDVLIGRNLNVTGISTFNDTVEVPSDSKKILLGAEKEMQVFHNGTDSLIKDTRNSGSVKIQADSFSVIDKDASETMLSATADGNVELKYDGSTKIQTTSTGATVTGTLVSGSVTSELDLTAISSSISDTAVDVFVYDTRKDSDGGTWRKRTQHTSWYNETLGTATRGTRREFPAVAVIVVDNNSYHIKIYDGDDPNMPLWMEFQDVASGSGLIPSPSAKPESIAAINGIIVFGNVAGTVNSGQAGVLKLDFIRDAAYRYMESGSSTYSGKWVGGGLVNRNTGTPTSGSWDNSLGYIVDNDVNDVAMTVLPNAPIDDATGLPVPTIAVGTQEGVSIIKDNGTVFDITSPSTNDAVGNIALDSEYVYFTSPDSGAATEDRMLFVYKIPSGDISNSFGYNDSDDYLFTTFPPSVSTPSIPSLAINNSSSEDITDMVVYDKKIFSALPSGLAYLDVYSTTTLGSSVAYITKDYNTGWMYEDIEGAFLSDTDTTNITGSEKIANHDFSADFSTQWEAANNATTSYDATNDRVTVTSTQNYSGIQLKSASLPTLTAGKRYIMTVDIHSITNPIYFGVVSGLTVSNVNSAGVWTGVFTASNVTEVFIKKPTGSNSTFVLNSVSIREAEEDRSVHNKALQVYGTVTKSAVATGAELVAYSGWSASNYLLQPYNPDLAPGTGAYSVTCWFKTGTSTGDQYIFDRSSGGSGSRNLLLIMHSNAGGNSANKLQWWHRDSSGNYTDVHITDKTVTDNAWHQVVALYDGSTYKVYVDGIASSVTSSVGRNVGNDGSPAMYVGVRHSETAPILGSLASFRYSRSAPSAEQVRKMYEDEKRLFQENAKATLYGSSDAVTALAYDEDTELLHVGTSSGRSDFQGLRRINNTTTAVTTAISASDDLIAEQ